MTVSRRVLCVLYGLVAVTALLGTWTHFLGYLRYGYFRGFQLFWDDTLLHPASRFITVESLLIDLTLMTWAVLEARRLGIRWVWVYWVIGIFVAISFTFPLFLIHRERVLARREQSPDVGRLGIGDVIGLVVVAGVIVVYLVTAFVRPYPSGVVG